MTNHHFRRARETIAEREALAQDSEEAIKRKEKEAEERKKASHDLVAESIRRELLESAYPYHAYVCLVFTPIICRGEGGREFRERAER